MGDRRSAGALIYAPVAMHVRRASEREVEERSRLTANVWGDRITLEQYLERERLLAAAPFARRGLRTWLLEDRAGAVLASCETYRMTSVFDGVMGATHGFASVFVEPHLRGHAYARALIERVVATLREEGAQAAHLFSEVGASLYSAAGFRVRPCQARRWDAESAPIADVALAFSRAGAEDVLRGRLAAGADPHARFRIVLDHEQLEWHRVRARAYHRFLCGGDGAGDGRPSPDTLAGAVAGSGWVAWFADYRLGRLLVLAARPGLPEDARALVAATRRAAAALGFGVAEHWESAATALPGGEVRPLDDEIPMILPLVDGLSPGDWSEYGRGCWI